MPETQDQLTEPRTFETRRAEEIEAGRARFSERQKQEEGKGSRDLLKLGDEALKEDEKRREELLNAEPDWAKAERDRAGAEVIDQAQTELEAIQHLADQAHTIVSARHEFEVETLEHEDVDTGAAEGVTNMLVTAQAVHQPTPMANEQLGVETEDRPLNHPRTGFNDAEFSARTAVPEDRLVPKTEPMAREVADVKIPPAEQVVREGAIVSDNDPRKNKAVEIVRRASKGKAKGGENKPVGEY